MSTTSSPGPVRPSGGATFPWFVILALVGLDYFSSLAYLPSLAMEQVGKLAPLAAAGVVLVTLLGALPVYWYVVGRSPDGKGGVGLLSRRFHGWGGKFVVLALLGFIATDFVLTRSLSVSDAATHVSANQLYKDAVAGVKDAQPALRAALPEWAPDWAYDMWTEQLVVSVVLSVVSFALYFFLIRTLSRGFTSAAVTIVVLYLFLNLFVLGAAALHVAKQPALITDWASALQPQLHDIRIEGGWTIGAAVLIALYAFPPMALGLSGFELSLATAPMIDPAPGDTAENPRGRIRAARFLMLTAAVTMCVLVLLSVTLTTLVVDPEALKDDKGVMQHRALAYLAHGGKVLETGPNDEGLPNTLGPVFGATFGTLYDLTTVCILCLAGASATISLKDIVPDFLAKFGMQLTWAHRIGAITHIFNGVILLVTIAFGASVDAQQGAYATAVIALLFGAALAATLDVRHRIRGSLLGRPLQVPFIAITIAFAAMGLLIAWWKPTGVAIALGFVLAVLITAIVSRWLRSMEMRCDGFAFVGEPTRLRWNEICALEFQVLAPYHPGDRSLPEKKKQLRDIHRIAADVPIVFVEVYVGDPSDFAMLPVMEIFHKDGEEIIKVSRCTSIAHVLAAIALAFREVGRPPELHFGWSEESPLAATLGFVLFGQGNIPWMVHALIKRAEPDPERRPRVVVG